jgi:hypothetical protein
MPPAGIEPSIPASERPQTHALDRTATGIGPRLITQTHTLFEVTGSTSLPKTLVQSLVQESFKRRYKLTQQP